MQVLADIGFEFGSYKGLGWIQEQFAKYLQQDAAAARGWNNVLKSKPSCN